MLIIYLLEIEVKESEKNAKILLLDESKNIHNKQKETFLTYFFMRLHQKGLIRSNISHLFPKKSHAKMKRKTGKKKFNPP